MSVKTSKIILKVFGSIGVLFGGITTLGCLLLIGGAAGLGSGDVIGTLMIVSGLIALITAGSTLAQGICSLIASNDSSMIMPAWIFSIIGVVSSGISLISSISKGSGVFNAVISLGISALIYVAANTIKNSNG